MARSSARAAAREAARRTGAATATRETSGHCSRFLTIAPANHGPTAVNRFQGPSLKHAHAVAAISCILAGHATDDARLPRRKVVRRAADRRPRRARRQLGGPCPAGILGRNRRGGQSGCLWDRPRAGGERPRPGGLQDLLRCIAERRTAAAGCPPRRRHLRSRRAHRGQCESLRGSRFTAGAELLGRGRGMGRIQG